MGIDKSLLRHPLAVSSLDDLANDEFYNVIDEIDNLTKSKVSRVILCAGKIYYELLAKRREHKITDIAIIRLEQLYPFAEVDIKAVLKKYKPKEIIWVQEEPKNQGAYLMIRESLQNLMPKGIELGLISRQAFAAPASGIPSLHNKQQNRMEVCHPSLKEQHLMKMQFSKLLYMIQFYYTHSFHLIQNRMNFGG